MTSSKGRRPSPAMIVAATALIVALAGTAMAAPTAIKSVLNKQEKKQTKKIARNQANNQITQRAPGLSVANANQANTATSAGTAGNAEALSGNTIVGEGDLDGPGLVTNSSCTPVSEPAPGAQPGDHVVLTPPSGWPSYEINLTARVTPDMVTYEICNQSGVMQNFGTSPPVRFLVFR